MKLHFPRAALAFVLLWALMAIFPPTREVFRAASATKLMNSGQDPRVLRHRLAAWHRQFPDSVSLEAWRLESSVSVEQSAAGGVQFPRGFRDALSEMDALIARFPADLSLRAQRVRMSLLQPIGSATKTQKLKQGMDAADYNLALQVAREAEGREPDNGFWPWTEATFQFALGRPEASLAALERAARCPRHNSYVSSTVQERAAWLKRVAHPVWEEKQTFPFISPGFYSLSMTKTLDAASEAALGAREIGAGPRAAQIEAAALGALHNWRRSDSDIDERASDYYGRRTLERFLGLRAPTSVQLPSGSWADTQQLHKTKLALGWSSFARQNGHPEWASRADFLRAPEADTTYDFYDLWREFGLPAPWGRIATLGPLVLMGLAALCWGGALTWLLGEAFRRITQPRVASEEAAGGEVAGGEVARSAAGPTRGQVAACANFSAWSLGGTLAVCLVGLGWSHLDIWSVSAAARDGQMVDTLALLSLIVAGSWLLPVAYATGKRGQLAGHASRSQAGGGKSSGRGPRAWGWAPFLLAATGLFLHASQPYSVRVVPSHSVGMAFWLVLVCASLAGALCLEWARFRRTGAHLKAARPAASAVPRLLRAGLWLLGPVFGFAAWQTESFTAFWLAISGAAALAGAFCLEWKGERREGFAFALQLATRSAGVLALVWSVVFGMCCVRLWPVRVELNHQFDRRLQIGERAWAREKADEQKSRG